MECLDGLKVLLVHHITDREVFGFTKPNSAYHDITICLNGKMNYVISGETITLREGDAIYCPAGTKMVRHKSGKASYLSVNFTTKHNESLPIAYFMNGLLSHEISQYIEIISHLLKNPGMHNDEKLVNIVTNLLIKVVELQEANHPMPYVDKIKLYVKDNFQKAITLESVSKYVNLHPSYCSTIFKKSEGISVTEYINFLRINQAKELLDTSPYRIGEIGARCGIPDPYYFSRVFNKICGISPSEYRKIARAYGGGLELSYETDEADPN